MDGFGSWIWMANYLTFDDGPMVGVGNMMMVGWSYTQRRQWMMDDFEETVVRSRLLLEGGRRGWMDSAAGFGLQTI